MTGHVEVGPTESYARRTVGLPSSICDDLGEHLATLAAEQNAPLQEDQFVFAAPKGGPSRRDLLLKPRSSSSSAHTPR